MHWRFGDLTLDVARSELRRGEAAVRLEPKGADLLRYLLESAGRVVPKDELLAAVWPDVAVTGSSLMRAVSLLRRALRELGASEETLRTVARRGYVVEAAAHPEMEDAGAAAAEAPSDRGFVGREHELAALLRAAAEAREGRGGVAVVEGEGGIGKTSLLRELAAREAPAMWVIRAAARGEVDAPAFGPWIELLAALSALRRPRGAAPQRARDLADLLPGSGAARPARDPDLARRALFAGVARALRDAARLRPLLVLLDDLHLADPASLRLAAEVAGELAGARVLLLVAHRPVHGERGALLRDGLERIARAGRRLPLGAFSAHEVERLVATIAMREAAPDVVAEIARRSGGNPLFARELLWLHEAGAGPRAVPATLAHAIRERLEGLAEPCLALLARAAAIGAEFPLALLGRASGLAPQRVLEMLEPAEARRLVAPVAGAASAFAFTHELVRDALYADLSSARRAALHAEIAGALEELSRGAADPPWRELARHHGASLAPGSALRAGECAARAAERAQARLAFEDAIALYRDALRWLEGEPAAAAGRRAELLVGLGDACYFAGDGDAAEGAYAGAVRAAREGGAVEAMATAAVRLAERQRGNVGAVPHERLAILEEALAKLPAGDGEARAAVLSALGQDLAFADFERARAANAASLAMARRLGRCELVLRALSTRAQLLLRREDASEREALAREELALARAAGDRVAELFAHYHAFAAALARGDAAAAREALSGCELAAGACDDPVHRGYAEASRACLALWQGDLAAAEAACLAAGRSLSDHRSREIGFLVRTSQLYQLRRLQGRLAELAPFLEEGVRAYPELTAFRCAHAHLLAETGRLEEARAALASIVDRELPLGWNTTRAAGLALLAETCARVGDAERAPRIRSSLESLGGGHVTLGALVCVGSARRYLGLLAWTCGERDEALAHFEAALLDERRAGAKPLEALAAFDCARLRRERAAPGDLARAREEAQRAQALARNVGLPSLQSAVRGLLSDELEPAARSARGSP